MPKRIAKSIHAQVPLNEAYLRVLYWFFSYPAEEVGLSELAEELRISKSTANKVVGMLSKEGFLQVRNFGNLWRISCNREHTYNYSRKIAYNLMTIYECGILSDIREKFPGARAIVLFGSYRKGDDTQESDIDIAVEVAQGEAQVQHLGTIRQIGFRQNVKVNALVFSRKKIDINLFANIANGIVLEGFLEAKP
jgi:predicted nucleotidyltransferase